MLTCGNRTFKGKAVGIGAVFSCLFVLSFAKAHINQSIELLSYLSAVLIAAWAGGRNSGVLAMVLSVLAMLFVRPASLPVSPDVLALLLFTILGLALSHLGEELHRQADELMELKKALSAGESRIANLTLDCDATGLGTWRAFTRDFEALLAQSLRNRAPLTLVVGKINRHDGYDARKDREKTDAILLATHRIMARVCKRATDKAYRIKNDEFAMVLGGTDGAGYAILSARLTEALKGIGKNFPGVKLILGAAHAPVDGSDWNTLTSVAHTRINDVQPASLSLEPSIREPS